MKWVIALLLFVLGVFLVYAFHWGISRPHWLVRDQKARVSCEGKPLRRQSSDQPKGTLSFPNLRSGSGTDFFAVADS